MAWIEKTKKTFVSIIQGKFHIQTDENDPMAIKRDVIDKKTGKVSSTKFELVYSQLLCKLQKIDEREGNFGKQLAIYCSDEKGDIIINMPSGCSYAADFLKRLPNVDLRKNVILSPYSYETKEGKVRQGLGIIQDDVVLPNYYYDPKTKKRINGITEFPEDATSFESEDWRYFFAKEYKFLVSQALNLNWDKTTEEPNDQQKVNNDWMGIAENSIEGSDDLPF
ncbi:MAG: hypothetical protein EOL88_02350 [Bacteroidia bacterium]|nr:hypothetical protein [Bacteroidia bacterium]